MWWTLLFFVVGCGGDPVSPSAPEPSPPVASAPAVPAVPAEAPATAVPALPALPSITELPRPETVSYSAVGLDNGDWAPLLDLPNLSTGQTWSLGDVVGPKATHPAKAVIVSFSASWCGPCRASLPHFKELREQYGDALQIVIVTTDTTDATRATELRYLQQAGLNDVPLLVPTETDLMAWLGQRRNIPHFFILNQAGEVLVQDRGYGDKVKVILPKQLQFAMSHPEYFPR